jgi:hypothetical protein
VAGEGAAVHASDGRHTGIVLGHGMEVSGLPKGFLFLFSRCLVNREILREADATILSGQAGVEMNDGVWIRWRCREAMR